MSPRHRSFVRRDAQEVPTQGLNGIVSHSHRSVLKRAVPSEVFYLTEDTGARYLTQPQSKDTRSSDAHERGAVGYLRSHIDIYCRA